MPMAATQVAVLAVDERHVGLAPAAPLLEMVLQIADGL